LRFLIFPAAKIQRKWVSYYF